MNVAAGPKLAAAVTNAGGLGVIGGVGYTPKVLREQVSVYLLYSGWHQKPCPDNKTLDPRVERVPSRQEGPFWR